MAVVGDEDDCGGANCGSQWLRVGSGWASDQHVLVMRFSGVPITEAHPVWDRIWQTLRERGNVSGYRIQDGVAYFKVATEASSSYTNCFNIDIVCFFDFMSNLFLHFYVKLKL